MTPGARIVADAIAGGRLVGHNSPLPLIQHAHFFDVSAVEDLACAMMRECEGASDALVDRCYLPAPITWLETTTKDRSWGAFLCVGRNHPDEMAREFGVWLVSGRDQACVPIGVVAPEFFVSGDQMLVCTAEHEALTEDFNAQAIARVVGLLQVINRPGLGAHIKHGRNPLSLDVRRHKRSGLASAAVRGWTELVIRPGGPEGPWQKGASSADKPLHFVRAHRRRINGILHDIVAHWRGDERLGIKLTRYRVLPPRKAA